MAKLTDQLNDPTFTPNTPGGAVESNFLGGIAKVGSNFLDSLTQANRRASGGSGSTNNPALDEIALGEFQIKTGIDLSKPGGKELSEAQRLQKARDNGSLSGTAYDVRLQNWYADVMRKYPEHAHEILQEGHQRGLDDFIFRNANEENKLANNAFEQEVKAVNGYLDLAASKGRYLPGVMTQQQGVAEGIKLSNMMFEEERDKATVETLSKLGTVNKDLYERELQKLNSSRINRQLDLLSDTVNVGMYQLHNLYQAAGDDAGRNDQLQAIYSQMEIGLMQLQENMTSYMYKNPSTMKYKDAEGNDVESVVPYSENDINRVKAEIKVKQDMITYLKTKKPEEAKQFLEAFQVQSKVDAVQKFRGLMSLKEGMGLTIPQIMDMLALPELNSIPTATKAALLDEFSKGMGQVGESITAAALLDKVNNGLTPAVSGKTDEERNKAFSLNANLTQMFGSALVNANIDSATAKAYSQNFEKNASQVIYAVNELYKPSNINPTNTKAAIDMVFNTRFLDQLEAYSSKGGDPDTAKMMGTQAVLAAEKFVEAQKNAPDIQYLAELGQFVAMPSLQQAGSVSGPISFQAVLPQTRDTVRQLNNILYFAEKANDKFGVLEGSKQSIRDIIAGPGMINWAQEKIAAQKNQPSSQQLFDQAVSEFSFDNNPYDSPATGPTTSVQGDAIDQVMVREGGFVADDNGAGPTNYGINQKANPDVDVEKLTQEEAKSIYQSRYLAPVIEAGVPDEAINAVLDSAVNQGVSAALDMWKASKGDIQRFTELRIAKYKNTPVKKPKDMDPEKFPAYEEQMRNSWIKRAKESGGQS